MLGALTDFVSSPRGKWITLIVWVLVAGALLSQLPRLDEVRENEEALFLPGDAESTLAYELARDEFPARGTPTLIVLREAAGLGAPTLAAVDDLAAWMTGPDAPDNITDVRAPGAIPGLISPDRTTLYIFVELSGEPAEDAFADTVNAIRARTAALDLPGVEIAVGGPGGLVVDIVGVFRQIDTFLLLVTVTLVLALLIAIYRSPIMATIPLLGVGLVFQLAGGIAAWFAQQFDLPISGQATGIMTVVLFGTGTDYVLFVSARFREELTRNADRHEAMRRTMRGVGGAVASAGATILVASAALWFAVLRSYQTLGPVIALAVALMMLAALTLIPAVLTIIGRRAFWPVQPRLASGPATPADWRESIYGRIGGVVLRRPRAVLAATSAVLALLTAGLFAYQPTYDRLESLPDNTESVRSFELLRTGFPGGELARTRVFVSLAPGEQALDEGVLGKLDAMTLALTEHPLVAGAAGPSRPFGIEAGFAGGPAAEAARAGFVSGDGDEVRIDVVLGVSPYAPEALDAMTAEAFDTALARARSGWSAAAALADRTAVPDGDDCVHVLRDARPRRGGLRRRPRSIGSGAGRPVLPVRVPQRPERRLQHLPDVADPRGGSTGAAGRGDPPRARAHGPRDHLGRAHPRGDVLGADDAAAAGPAPARLRGRGRRADGHVHHAHADRAVAGGDVRALELVAVADRGVRAQEPPSSRPEEGDAVSGASSRAKSIIASIASISSPL